MTQYSTPQAAEKLRLSLITLNRYIAAKKIPVPEVTEVGRVKVRLWSDEDIERVRVLLPKIANGRRKHSAISTQPSAKPRPKTKSKTKTKTKTKKK